METRSYVYDSSWGDLLTKYNGKTVGHDAIGNMTSYNGSSYSWQGRELRKITNGSNTYSYKYNADGIRTSKTVNGTTTEFFLNGTQVLAQKTGDSVMRFIYDSTGKRVGFANGIMLFYYLYNLQGDVIAIVRAATGQVVAKYTYDARGNCTVTNAAGYAVGDKNPFRYRGYYYDTETGLYYLNSRYYNPEFGRFISADGLIDNRGATSRNLFAYCGNNPVNRSDLSGLFWKEIGNWFKRISTKIEEYLTPSNIYGSTVGGASIVAPALGAALVGGIKNSPRPNNIGAGTYAKQCAKEISSVSKISKGASKILSVAAYGAAIIDVGVGVYDNIRRGASAKRVALDAVVDATITCGSVWAAGALGSAVGTAIGTIIPGAGNIIGAGAGFIIGIGIYALTDMVSFNGETARTKAKRWINNLW